MGPNLVSSLQSKSVKIIKLVKTHGLTGRIIIVIWSVFTNLNVFSSSIKS